MSSEHSPALCPASAQKIIGGLRHVIAELDELARDAPTRWAERITWVTVTAEDVAGGIEAELIEDGSAAAREGSLAARTRWWHADYALLVGDEFAVADPRRTGADFVHLGQDNPAAPGRR